MNKPTKQPTRSQVVADFRKYALPFLPDEFTQADVDAAWKTYLQEAKDDYGFTQETMAALSGQAPAQSYLKGRP